MKFGTTILFIALIAAAATTTEATIRGSTSSSSRRRVRDSTSRYDGLTNAIDASSLNKIKGRFLQQMNAVGAKQPGGGGGGVGDANEPLGPNVIVVDEPERKEEKPSDDEKRGDKDDTLEKNDIEVDFDGSMSMVIEYESEDEVDIDVDGSMSMSMRM